MNRLTEIEERLSQITEEIETRSGDELAALNEEQQRLIAERTALMAEVQTREEIRNRAASLGITIEQVPVSGNQRRSLDDLRRSDEYVNAYVDYIRSGDPRQIRTLLTDLVDGGTIPTPISLQEAIETSWANTDLVRRARHISIKGEHRIPFELSASEAQDHVEGDVEVEEESLVLGMVTLKPTMVKKWISMSDEVVALKGQAFLNYINAEIAQRIAEKADAKLVAAIKACPAAATTTAVDVPTVTVSAIAFDTIFKALALLSDDAKNPIVIMQRAMYFNSFMSLKDLQNRPIYNIVADNGKPSFYLNGIECVFSDAVDDDEIIVGDMAGVTVNFPEGNNIVMKYDDKTLMTKDIVRVLGRQYVAFGVTKRKYFVKVSVNP